MLAIAFLKVHEETADSPAIRIPKEVKPPRNLGFAFHRSSSIGFSNAGSKDLVWCAGTKGSPHVRVEDSKAANITCISPAESMSK